MNSSVTHIERNSTPRAEQLTLLSVPEANPRLRKELKTSSAHARFLLSTSARARGLAHVAEIRRQLAEAQASRESGSSRKLPTRADRAA